MLGIDRLGRFFSGMLLACSLAVGSLVWAVPAWADAADDAAQAQVKAAIDTHYLATEFDQAQTVLLDAIKGCGTQCSPQTVAKAWMYVGQ